MDDKMYAIERDALKDAEKYNQIINIPTDYELQLDLDTLDAFDLYLQRIEQLKEEVDFQITDTKITVSKSGLPHRHVYITCAEPMSIWQRIALQFFLGSDEIREGLNLKRVIYGNEVPIALFEERKE